MVGSQQKGSSYSVSSELLALLPPNCRPRRVLEKKKGFYFKLLTTARLKATAGLTAQSLSSERAFGPLGTTPVQRESRLGRRDYWAFALSGAICTATIRTALVRTRGAQTPDVPTAARALHPCLPYARCVLLTRPAFAPARSNSCPSSRPRC